MTNAEFIIVKSMQLSGLIFSLGGLWLVVRGLRVVVSNRIDEKQHSGRCFKIGIPFLILGILALAIANWVGSRLH